MYFIFITVNVHHSPLQNQFGASRITNFSVQQNQKNHDPTFYKLNGPFSCAIYKRHLFLLKVILPTLLIDVYYLELLPDSQA